MGCGYRNVSYAMSCGLCGASMRSAAALGPQAVANAQIRGMEPLRHHGRRQHGLGVQPEGHDLAVTQLARYDAGGERICRHDAHADDPAPTNSLT